MQAQTRQHTLKTYTDQLEAILAEPGTNQDKIQRIAEMWLSADNGNAVYIQRLAQLGQAPEDGLRRPTEEGIAEAIAARQLRQIKQVLNDLRNLNLYYFQYQLWAHYNRVVGADEEATPEHRVLLNTFAAEEFPVKDQARQLAIDWHTDIPRSFKEGADLPAFELDHIETYCVVQDSYENEITKESSGRFMPPSEFVSDHYYWNRD